MYRLRYKKIFSKSYLIDSEPSYDKETLNGQYRGNFPLSIRERKRKNL